MELMIYTVNQEDKKYCAMYRFGNGFRVYYTMGEVMFQQFSIEEKAIEFYGFAIQYLKINN